MLKMVVGSEGCLG
jgi:hypothetical protein